MIDGGLVVGYLSSWLIQGVGRLANRQLDNTFSALYDRVAARLGRSATDALANAPHSDQQKQILATQVAATSQRDPSFAAELAQLINQIERLGGQQILNQNRGDRNVQIGGNFQGGHIITGHASFDQRTVGPPHLGDYSKAPGWVKAVTALGALLLIGGMIWLVVSVFLMLTSGENDQYGRPTLALDVLAPAGIACAAGLALSIIGSLGRSMSR